MTTGKAIINIDNPSFGAMAAAAIKNPSHTPFLPFASVYGETRPIDVINMTTTGSEENNPHSKGEQRYEINIRRYRNNWNHVLATVIDKELFSCDAFIGQMANAAPAIKSKIIEGRYAKKAFRSFFIRENIHAHVVYQERESHYDAADNRYHKFGAESFCNICKMELDWWDIEKRYWASQPCNYLV